jgi:Superinfection immunity protein
MHVLAATAASAGGAAVGFVLLIVAAALYFIPGIVAQVRHVPHLGSVWIINIFLGWTFIGWIVALAMAARSQLPAQQVIIQQGWQTGGPGIAGQPGSPGIQPPPGFQPSGEAQPEPWGQTHPLPQWGQEPGRQQWPQG